MLKQLVQQFENRRNGKQRCVEVRRFANFLAKSIRGGGGGGEDGKRKRKRSDGSQKNQDSIPFERLLNTLKSGIKQPFYDKMGEGAYGTVFDIGKEKVCKIMKAKAFDKNNLESIEANQAIQAEIKLSEMLGKEGIGPLVHEIKSLTQHGMSLFGIVMDKYDSDLFDWLETEEANIDNVVNQVVSLISKLVKKGYTCIDMKPGNIVVRKKEGRIDVRLIDFDGDFCTSTTDERKLISKYAMLLMLLVYSLNWMKPFKYNGHKLFQTKLFSAIVKNFRTDTTTDNANAIVNEVIEVFLKRPEFIKLYWKLRKRLKAKTDVRKIVTLILIDKTNIDTKIKGFHDIVKSHRSVINPF